MRYSRAARIIILSGPTSGRSTTPTTSALTARKNAETAPTANNSAGNSGESKRRRRPRFLNSQMVLVYAYPMQPSRSVVMSILDSTSTCQTRFSVPQRWSAAYGTQEICSRGLTQSSSRWSETATVADLFPKNVSHILCPSCLNPRQPIFPNFCNC